MITPATAILFTQCTDTPQQSLGLIWKLTQLKMCQKFVKWLAEAFVKIWPTEKELEMPDIPRLSVDEGILRLMEIGMVEWVGTLCKSPAMGRPRRQSFH